MTYLALYRAWRPQSFQDIVGQEHITTTLQNALREKRFSHAYLFSGPRGTGKTSTAKILAKAVNCEKGPSEEPCNQCNTCQRITEGSVLDVVEIDAASNRGVEEIRDLREKVKFAPTETRYKVYIIDEVHMLTTEAFNALLKTLEEPPPHVIFILATTEPHKLPLTIISRCQRFDFRRITVEKMVDRLAHIANSEGFTLEKDALSIISRNAEGGMRDALSLMDQILSFSDHHITVEDVLKVIGTASYQAFSRLAKAIFENNIVTVLNITYDLIQEGKEPEKMLEDLLYYYRDLLLYKSAPSLDEVKDKVILDEEFPEIAQNYEDEQLYLVIETLNQYLQEMKKTNQRRIILDLALVKITNILAKETKDHHDLAKEVEELRKKVEDLELKLNHLPEINATSKDSNTQQPQKKSLGHKNSGQQIIKQLEHMSKAFSQEHLQKLLSIWPKILQAVKQKKVTVHAWLMDGEPVAVTDDTLVLAFQNQMHRDTTDKAANRQLIEEVLYELFNKPFHILNIMKKDWNHFHHEQHDQEKLNNQVDADLTGDSFVKKDDFVKQAIDWFGEDLVEIKD